MKQRDDPLAACNHSSHDSNGFSLKLQVISKYDASKGAWGLKRFD